MRDRTGLKTIHPELLDGNGQLIKDDLLTVSFENVSEEPSPRQAHNLATDQAFAGAARPGTQ